MIGATLQTETLGFAAEAKHSCVWVCRKAGCVVDCYGSGVRSAAYPGVAPLAQVRRAAAKVAPVVACRRAPLNQCVCVVWLCSYLALSLLALSLLALIWWSKEVVHKNMPQALRTKTPGGVPPGGMNPTTVWLFAWPQQPIPKHLTKGCCLDGAFCQQQREPRNSWVLGCWQESFPECFGRAARINASLFVCVCGHAYNQTVVLAPLY